MYSLLAQAVQPALITIFSSTSSNPIVLSQTSHSLNSQHSIVALLPDNAPLPLPTPADDPNSEPAPAQLPLECQLLAHTANPIWVDDSPGAHLRSRVLHLQDTDIRNTFCRLGASQGKARLGVENEWLHFAIRRLGGRAVYLEAQVRDKRGQRLVVRCSTFKTEPTAHPPTSTSPCLLHLPLTFPSPSPSLLTSWSTISLHLPTLVAAYHALPLSPPSATASHAGGALDHAHARRPPQAEFAVLDRVEVHANCRLRRVWCSMDGGEGVVDEGRVVRGTRTELGLFESVGVAEGP